MRDPIENITLLQRQINELQIEKFLKNHPDFEKGKMELILPNSENQQDGFFICELIKK